MILFDDLQFLLGLYVIIFLFYFGFFVNRYRFLLKYDDPGYLAYETKRLKLSGASAEETERVLAEMIRRKNRYNVYNVIFFLFYALSFFVFLKLLMRSP